MLSQAVHAVTCLSCVPRRSQLLLQGSGDLSGIKEKIVRKLERHPHIALAEDVRCRGWKVPEAAPSAVLSAADAYLGVTNTSKKQSIGDSPVDKRRHDTRSGNARLCKSRNVTLLVTWV